jgi:hypothetical protein
VLAVGGSTHDGVMARTGSGLVGFLLARTSGGSPDPAVVVQRARPFGAAVGAVGQATLLTVAGATGISNYVLTSDDARSGRLAGNLADAVGAEARAVEVLPELPADGCLGWVVARPSERASRDTQSGGDPAEVARLLGRVMTPGSWLAATVRVPSKREMNRCRVWYAHRLAGAATHHSNEGEALVVNFVAGAADDDEVRSLLSSLIAALPGFDVEVKVRTGSVLGRVLGLCLAAVAGGVAAVMLVHSVLVALLVAGLPLLVAGGYGTGRIPTRVERLAEERDSLRFRAAPVRRWPPRKPRRESTRTVRNTVNGQSVSQQRLLPARQGDYPLDETGFLVGASVLVGVAAPYTGAASGIASTASTSAPPALLEDIGPYVGEAGGLRVHVSAEDMIEGVGIFGLPGRGKTVLVQNLFACDVADRVAPSGRAGRCGASNTLIAFESKGEGAAGYQRWVGALGDASVFIDLADPGTPGIDLLAIPGTADQRADFMANMMQYVFGRQAIGDQSMNTLKAVFHAAFLLPPELAAEAVEGGLDAHPLAIAHGLLTGYGDSEGEALAAAYAVWAKQLSEADPLREQAWAAGRKLTLLYGSKVTPAQRRALTSAPISKTGMLMGAGFWWRSDRVRTSWEDILTGHWAVVINTGTSASGMPVSEDLVQAFSAMLAYSLRDAIQRYCGGWQAARRYVTVYSDELSLLAGSTGEVVVWLRNQGRSYGVRPVLASQYPGQLSAEVRDAVLSFSTFFWFQQNNPAMLEAAVADLNGGGAGYDSADVANLEPYRAILRATVGKQRQPPVPVLIAYWGPDAEHPDGRESEFVRDQGYAAPVRWPAGAEVMVEPGAGGRFAAYEGGR